MPIESASSIAQLNSSNPPDSDAVSQGAAHIRLLKGVLKTTFPNLDAPITLTDEVLNGLPSLVSALDAGVVKLTAANQTITGNIKVTGDMDAGVVKQGGYALVPAGAVIMWSGSHLAIPGGWALCDGSNGTPDLRNLFIMGAGGSLAVGSTGGSDTVSGNTAGSGAHSHGGATGAAGGVASSEVSLTALTEGQMPIHSHPGTALTAGAHRHGTAGAGGEGGGILADWRPGNTNNYILQSGGTDGFQTSTAGQHEHSVQTETRGGNQPHTHWWPGVPDHPHAIATEPPHAHTVSIPYVPPFYALAFIKKL